MQEYRGKSWLHVLASLTTPSFAKLIHVLPLASSLLGTGKRGETLALPLVGSFACSSLQMSLLVYGPSLLPSDSLQMCMTEAAAIPLQYQVSALAGGCRYLPR